ncbi:two-component system OmpR family response regulator [Pseudarthrobacter sp. W1I19]|uniref:response regulator transcription factor n=1 Tax=Pseudarthrobacter sp. W1I19 TaxID=3042288 RepID=UPI0027875A9D|nr:response regulator [Pseudarthrobacter sp. W1I19]MDQ0921993.1 two-component system OmpR family response regulator [Pseudarthrobacter sp. W1I19]
MENKRVCLVVEDNDDIRGLITVVLRRAGFEVRAVATGAEGIAAAADPAVSLVTLDLGLPDTDGHVVARAVRALSKAPLLFLTARSENDDILAGMASGAAAYLTKPFHPKELKDLAEQLCPAPVIATPLSQVPHIPGKSLC